MILVRIQTKRTKVGLWNSSMYLDYKNNTTRDYVDLWNSMSEDLITHKLRKTCYDLPSGSFPKGGKFYFKINFLLKHEELFNNMHKTRCFSDKYQRVIIDTDDYEGNEIYYDDEYQVCIKLGKKRTYND